MLLRAGSSNNASRTPGQNKHSIGDTAEEGAATIYRRDIVPCRRVAVGCGAVEGVDGVLQELSDVNFSSIVHSPFERGEDLLQ